MSTPNQEPRLSATEIVMGVAIVVVLALLAVVVVAAM